MKIVVVSDTHIPKRAKELPQPRLRKLKTTDRIIHAGDWQTIDVFHQLSAFAPVDGVFGNVDREDIKKIMPEKKIITIKGWKIGIFHGHGDRKTTEKRAIEALYGEVDCVVFGHSHIPYLRYVKKTLLFNPGSPTDKRKNPFYSFGIFTIYDTIRAEHVFSSEI
ncbi:putative phosphoesterase [Evansella vedderi]|uniref:Phosphoesterase n=1 Tax=Evansella vedderi TaxID=38282 RepID=A0ABT9ZWR2_9BACI|nr:metallophosphoesterase family protein [Evansella vedderi]MDQ0255658.1 putative phosphoesterase [Evansella vedderi]